MFKKIYLIFILLLLKSNIIKAQSIADTIAKRLGVHIITQKTFYSDIASDSAKLQTTNIQYYNLKGKIIFSFDINGHRDSIWQRINGRRDSIFQKTYYNYNRKGKLIKRTDIQYKLNDSTINVYHTNQKSDGRKKIYNKEGKLIEIYHEPTSYIIKDSLIYDSLGNLICFIKYRRDSMIEKSLYEYNKMKQMYKYTLVFYLKGNLYAKYETDYDYYENGLLKESYDIVFRRTDIYEYTFY